MSCTRGATSSALAHALARRLVRGQAPILVVSHAPPRGVGDHAANRYHLGYAAYRWLLDRLRPPLWLHGHVDPASKTDWKTSCGPTVVASDRVRGGRADPTEPALAGVAEAAGEPERVVMSRSKGPVPDGRRSPPPGPTWRSTMTASSPPRAGAPAARAAEPTEVRRRDVRLTAGYGDATTRDLDDCRGRRREAAPRDADRLLAALRTAGLDRPEG
jgi:hypothetical protein